MPKLKPSRVIQPVTEFRANDPDARGGGETAPRTSRRVKMVWSPLAERRALEAVEYIGVS